MYLAVAMDGNNQILPLAYGVGKSKTFRSWDWFLAKLKECIIGKQDNLTIISNEAVSIASAIKKEELFWRACKAYRISDFEEHFSSLIRAANKLDMIGHEKRARVHFLDMRYNYMTSNSEESVNALYRRARRLLICMMIDWFIKSLQQCANAFAFSCFKTSVWRASYNKVIHDVGHPSEWEKLDVLITVLPHIMDKP
ncbi:transmembrane 9 superfamily member 11-like protein [Tanacetum coccineum]